MSVIILMSRDSISHAAMDNVSFAATLLSIVLAVISIVISVVASFKTYNNLGGMQEVEKRINEAVTRLNDIECHITHTDRKMEDIISLLRPTPQAEIDREAERTIQEMQIEEPTKKQLFTVEDIRDNERKAVSLVAKELNLTNLMIDCSLKGLPHYNFDGVGKKGNVNWLIEVKLFRPGMTHNLISRLKDIKKRVTSFTGEPTEVIAVLLLTDTSNKKVIEETFTSRFIENGINVSFYYLSQLDV